MRNAFVRALTVAAEADERIRFLTADLGFKIFDDFARRCPGRFMNVGVAEATMAGVAAGMAMEGLKPFIYSIVPFATLRCYEQIRNDICYHESDVVVVGVGGGYSYGPNGPTHHALEDIAVTRVLPHMTVACPGDPFETEAVVRALIGRRGPAYLRLGRAGEPNVHSGPLELAIGQSVQLSDGADVTLLSTGNMLATAVAAAGKLGALGKSVRVVSMPFVKPLDAGAVGRALAETGALVTLEEHGTLGGFGSAVAERAIRMTPRRPFLSLGAANTFSHVCGDQEFHRKASGLTPDAIAASVLALLDGAA